MTDQQQRVEVPGHQLPKPRSGEPGHRYIVVARIILIVAICAPIVGLVLFFTGARLDGELQNRVVGTSVVLIAIWAPMIMSALAFQFQGAYTLAGRPRPWLNHAWFGIGAILAIPAGGIVGTIVLLGGASLVYNLIGA